MDMNNSKLETLTVGGGCFWCVEAVFQQLKGVKQVVSGYTGGTVPGTPTYREVSSGRTGCAEVVQVEFDSSVISYEELLFVFMTTHDPTTINQQGADVGTQYRSVIYFHSEKQKKIAEEIIEQLIPHFENPIVTEISPAEVFHKAEDYHQNYYNQNNNAGYCMAVISPKLAKLRKVHADKLEAKFKNL